MMNLKTDSYVLECNVHFPTDLNLTWDSLKKYISLIDRINKNFGNDSIQSISFGFTHFCNTKRRGKFKLGRKTSCIRLISKCNKMTKWLKDIRNKKKPKEWWDTLKAKLRGHFQYYGISGNYHSLMAFYRHTVRELHKWLNRRSQKSSMCWKNFMNI